MTDESALILGVLSIVFGGLGGLGTWSYRKDAATRRLVDDEKERREKDSQVIHSRINKTRENCERDHTKMVDAVSVVRTEVNASISAVRSEFQERISSSESKTSESLTRVHSRIDEIKRDMVTHDDANVHFKRIEDSLGNSFKALSDSISTLSDKVDVIATSWPRIDERVKNLEKKSGDE